VYGDFACRRRTSLAACRIPAVLAGCELRAGPRADCHSAGRAPPSVNFLNGPGDARGLAGEPHPLPLSTTHRGGGMLRHKSENNRSANRSHSGTHEFPQGTSRTVRNAVSPRSWGGTQITCGCGFDGLELRGRWLPIAGRWPPSIYRRHVREHPLRPTGRTHGGAGRRA